jgi:phosphoserine phosphatase
MAGERIEDQVIVLIAAPGKAVVDDEVLGEAVSAVAPFMPEVRWLDEEGREACEVAFTPPPASHYQPRSLEERLRGRLMGLEVDVAVLPLGGRRKKLLMADLDASVIATECIGELMAAVGGGAQVAAIAARVLRDGMSLHDETRHEAMALFGALPEETVREMIGKCIRIRPDAAVLAATMKAKGAFTALVSGGPAVVVRHVAEALGVDAWRACVSRTDGREPAGATEALEALEADGRGRLEFMRELVRARGLSAADVLAVGESAADVPMVEAAGLGVAWHAVPALRAVADARIDHGDLTALLYLQGYRRDEFVVPGR